MVKKVFKLLAVFLSLILVLTSFASCGDKGKDSNNEKDSEKGEVSVNTSLFGEWVDITVGDTTFSLPEIICVINNHTVKLPCNLQSFLEQSGLSLPEGIEISQYINPYDGYDVVFSDEFLTYFVNPTTKSIDSNDCLLYIITSNQYEIPAGFDIGKFKSLNDVEGTFGKPNSSIDTGSFQEIEYDMIDKKDDVSIGAVYEFYYTEANGVYVQLTYIPCDL